MKILVVDFAATEGGALSVLKEYYDKAKQDKENEYIFLINDNYIKETKNIKKIILKKEKNWIKRIIFDLFKGKKLVKKINPDIIFSLQNTTIFGTSKRKILYVHQAIPFQKKKKFSPLKKSELKLFIIQYLIGYLIKKSIKISDEIIVQTKWMKDSIIKECKVNVEKIKVESPQIKLLKIKNTNVKLNHFFYPTSDYIYKNNNLIKEAATILKNKGISDFKVELTIEGNDENNIYHIGKISREEVFEKYTNSVLIFPSYIETFGLPLLEAKNCNTIILASDCPFSHEILDDYDKVYFFNPFDAKELANLMELVINKKGSK